MFSTLLLFILKGMDPCSKHRPLLYRAYFRHGLTGGAVPQLHGKSEVYSHLTGLRNRVRNFVH